VTAGLCVFWIAFGAADRNMGPGQGLLGGVTLAIVTVLGYLAYRRARGWKVLPPRRPPDASSSSRRRIALSLLSLLLIGVAGVAMGNVSKPTKGSDSGGQEAPWTKSMSATTCGDWLSVMSGDQRKAFSEALLAYDLSKPHGPALDAATASDYVSMITGMCREESSSSLVVQ
jgi:hypothetical protein